MILKLLLVIGVIATVYFMFIKQKPAVTKTSTKANKKNPPKANDMIECATCGIYCEIDDAIISNSKYYCSNECVTKA